MSNKNKSGSATQNAKEQTENRTENKDTKSCR